jgi:hypothetical protein
MLIAMIKMPKIKTLMQLVKLYKLHIMIKTHIGVIRQPPLKQQILTAQAMGMEDPNGIQIKA